MRAAVLEKLVKATFITSHVRVPAKSASTVRRTRSGTQNSWS